MPRHRFYAALLVVLMPGSASAGPILAGSSTHGGAVPGSAVIHVTSLADSGPGSLREAIQTRGAKVIVFDVAGTIRLASDLKISTDETTIAGQTAPSPGVTLMGGTLLLRASNLVVQHIAVRPGPGANTKINGNRDSITIGGGKHELHDIRVENVSVSWSVDENMDVAGGTRNVTVRNSIIAEALRNAGHPKGPHSMGFLVNKDNQGVAITGNLLVSNIFRNPVIARGSSAFVGYNLIVNPGQNGIHFYAAEAPEPLEASVIDNVIEKGPDTDDNVTAVQVPDDMAQKVPDARIYLAGNQSAAGDITNRGDFALVKAPPVTAAISKPAEGVRAFVLRYAGSRPEARNDVDARIVNGVRDGTSKVIDNPDEVGGMTETRPVESKADVPQDPFGPSRLRGTLRIEAWLCERHLQAGGPRTPECSRPSTEYSRAIS